MKKIYVSNAFEVAGTTPDKVVAKVCEHLNNRQYDRWADATYTPICAVKVGANTYKGLYKTDDKRDGVSIHQVTIRVYQL